MVPAGSTAPDHARCNRPRIPPRPTCATGMSAAKVAMPTPRRGPATTGNASTLVQPPLPSACTVHLQQRAARSWQRASACTCHRRRRHLRHWPRPGPAQLGCRHQRTTQRCQPVHVGHRARRAPAAGRRELDFLPGFTSLPAARPSSCSRRPQSRAHRAVAGLVGHAAGADAIAGGAAQLATGIDLRQERWTSHPDALLSQGDLALGLPQEQRHLARRSGGAYAELGLPLAHTLAHGPGRTLGPRRRLPAFSPRVGVRWSPTPRGPSCLQQRARLPCAQPVRAAAPPGLFRCDRAAASSALPDCAQSSGNGRCSVTVDVVENDALKAERSRSHSLAATWTPTDTFSLSLTHNIVELRNEILPCNRPTRCGTPAPGSWTRRPPEQPAPVLRQHRPHHLAQLCTARGVPHRYRQHRPVAVLARRAEAAGTAPRTWP